MKVGHLTTRCTPSRDARPARPVKQDKQARDHQFQFNSLFVSDLSIHSYTIVNLNLNAINVHIYINEKVVEIVLQIRNPIDNRK